MAEARLQLYPFMRIDRMMRCISFAAACGLVSTTAWAADIELSSGRVLKDARIVTITDKAVSILHADGTEAVEPAELDLEVLARAHMELEARTRERKQKEAEIKAGLAARAEQAKREQAENQQLARAFENADAGVGSLRKLSPIPAERKLIAVKQSFPVQQKKVYSSKAGRFEYMVPTHEVHSHYRGMVNIATLDSAPQVVARLRARLIEDLKTYETRGNSAIGMDRAKYHDTVRWLRGPLAAYLDTLEATRL